MEFAETVIMTNSTNDWYTPAGPLSADDIRELDKRFSNYDLHVTIHIEDRSGHKYIYERQEKLIRKKLFVGYGQSTTGGRCVLSPE